MTVQSDDNTVMTIHKIDDGSVEMVGKGQIYGRNLKKSKLYSGRN
jgi:hypothetical protein